MATSAPPGYDIGTNQLKRDLDGLVDSYRLIGIGKFQTCGAAGPPGIGKSVLARKHLACGERVIREVRPSAAALPDVLYKYRNARNILLFDDTNFVWNSEPTLNLLNIAANSDMKRVIPDNRKTVGHGNFLFEGGLVFLTNKRMFEPTLADFQASMRSMIEPVISRFKLRRSLSYDPLDSYHYTCWLASDGGLLRNLVDPTTTAHLSLAASNEVLAWFAEHYPRLKEISPRTMVNVGELRLKAPGIWESQAEEYLTPDSRQEIGKDGKPHDVQPLKAVWQIKPTGAPKIRQPVITAKPEIGTVIAIIPPKKPRAKPAAKPAKPTTVTVKPKPIRKGKA